MEGAVLANNPYHNNPSANLTNKELADRIGNVIFYDKDIEDSLEKLKDKDFLVVFQNECLLDIKPLSRLGIPIIMTSGDIPKRLSNDVFKKIVSKHKVKGIIVENKCSIPAFKDYLERGEDLDYVWYPWGIDENYIKDYKEEKIYDVSQLGQFNIYQYRREINFLLSNYANIKYYRFPPLRDSLTKKENTPYDIYCKTINQSWISIGGCIQHKEFESYNGKFIGINFSKNIEIPGCKTALFNTKWGDMEDLGFKDCVNFVEFRTPSDCRRKILKFLEEKEELQKIIDNGYKLVHKYHTNKIHVDAVLKDLEKIL